MASNHNRNELLQAQTLVWKHSFSFTITATLQCVVLLGIPDIINKHGQPMTLLELIAALKINPSKACHISRLMRILVLSGFVVRQKLGDNDDNQEEGYTLTLAGRLLLQDGPFTTTAFLFSSRKNPCDSLVDWFQNDDPTAMQTAFGKSFWGYAAEEPVAAHIFNQTMANDSNLVAEVLISDCKYVFEGLTSLVDVGGGIGKVAGAIAEAFPNLKCTVLDQPQVVVNQRGTTNLDFVGGDMFDKIPLANAVLLKWVLHNWPDEECVKILKKCKEAIPSKDKGGKLIIIETVIETGKEDKELAALQLSWDIYMMALFAAKERNKEEWEKLFFDAGFSDYKIMPVLGLRSLIEVYP